MLIETSEYTTEDISYLRHGTESLMLRLYRPFGPGPFPLVVDLHGGAWTAGDLADCEASSWWPEVRAACCCLETRV